MSLGLKETKRKLTQLSEELKLKSNTVSTSNNAKKIKELEASVNSSKVKLNELTNTVYELEQRVTALE